MKKIIIIVLTVVGVLGLALVLFLQDQKTSQFAVNGSNPNIPQVGQEITILGRDHLKDINAKVDYNSNPPTSGAHFEYAEKWGVFNQPQPDVKMVHNLEHGGIWISYKDIDEQTKAQLEAIAKANPGSVIMTPRSKNDSKIALASWGRLVKLDAYDETKILEFIKANKNKSPEALAR
ncbi:MAG: DUF3105 domain-containing protein [Patescibacteria group bacterium]